MRRQLSAFVLIVGLSAAAGGRAADYIWIEGEKPDHLPAPLREGDGVERVRGGKGYDFSGWGRLEIISEEALLHVNMSGREVDSFLPEGGLVLGYDFTLPEAGSPAIWARIGYEWVRSEFDWRIDDGPWQTLPSTRPTVNIQPMQTWNELAWIRLGTPALSGGKHTLRIRHSARIEKKGDKDVTARILHMLDCLCITAEAFKPAGKWKPHEDHSDDEDKAAGKQVFDLSCSPGADGRAWTVLNGLWQYAPWEETTVSEADRLQPVRELDVDLDGLRWWAYEAPGRREQLLPEQSFAHRYLLRTRVRIPEEARGKSLFLDVQRANMLVSVFLNGVFCGHSDKAFHTAWQVDVSKAVKPGTVNELVLVVKDAYYALNPTGDEKASTLGNRRYWNLPIEFLHRNMGVAGRMDWPVNRDVPSGLHEPASLVVCGSVYAEDVFPKPSVKAGRLELLVSVRNPANRNVRVSVRNRVVPWNKGKGGPAELTLPEKAMTVPANGIQSVEVAASWSKPTLWWPDAPHLYWVETEIVGDGEVLDLRRTRFGFREWDWSGRSFKLNGINWPLWADLTENGSSPEKQVAHFNKVNQNHIRYWRDGGLGGYTRREAMDYYDEHGLIVRSSGILDGQIANYGGGLREPDLTAEKDSRGRYPLKAKTRFWDAWREQLAYWVKEERRHPSIMIWSLENEIAYINVNNLGQWRECEPELTQAAARVKELDPTRPSMVDGGNCLRDESLEVNGGHYTELVNAGMRDFPDAAYNTAHWEDPERPQRGAWRVVPDRPYFGGEIYFAEGYPTEKFATIGGERCFIGRGETTEARGLWGKILAEGYRWCGVAAYQFWKGDEGSHLYWNSWKPTAVLCRQWNWTWNSAQTVARDLRVFNTTRFNDPIDVHWELTLAGKSIADGRRQFRVEAGGAADFPVSLTLPRTRDLLTGAFTLTARRKGRVVFEDMKPVRVLAPESIPLKSIGKTSLAVYDPRGDVRSWLTERGIAFTPVERYGAVPDAARLVVVGSDAIPADKTTDPLWYGLAAAGKRVVILDQAHPLRYRALPADLKPTDYVGRIGFAQDLSHPAFSGLTQADFFTWGNDHIVYRNVYRKAGKGGRSLFHCDDGLGCTGLFESQVADGLLLLCQLNIGSKLASGGAAEQLLANLFNYAADYVPVRKECRVVMGSGDARAELLNRLALKQAAAGDPLGALVDGQIAVVDATPANLARLTASRARVEDFCRGGGWLMLWGLTPDGLASFNRLVGHEHVLRPFERERVLLSTPLDPMASGLTLQDVVMDTGQKMYGWMALKTPDTDSFSYLVDHTDIAPFCTFPKPTELGKPSDTDPGVDHWPRNMVNGFTSDDNWAFTYTIIMDRGDARKFTLTLPKEEELAALRIRPSRIYHPITRMNVYFDEDPVPLSVEIPVRTDPIIEDIPIAGRKARRITLEVAEWAERGTRNIVVIDNLWLIVKRNADYRENVSSILNVGGLMKYGIGRGGILLNQLKILEREQNPVNAVKKRTIVKTLLANAGAVFSGGKTVVVGTHLRYEPVAIGDGAFNAYVHHRGTPGWFKGSADMSALPVGDQTFAQVDFRLSDFSTSPVPSVFMLGCRANQAKEQVIRDISIGRKADALFFLHTAHPERDTSNWERNWNDPRRRKRAGERPALFRYVVHYADGGTVNIPVRWKQEIGPWLTKEPEELPNAALAWVGAAPKSRKDERLAVYVMQWTNPRPEVAVKHVDIQGIDGGKWGAPAVFAITLATVEQT
jgi:hypothetical protein